MAYTLDRNDSAVFQVLGDFITSTLGGAVQSVVRGPVNRVASPSQYPYIVMSPVLKEEITRPQVTISDPATQPQTAATTMSTRYQIQVDAFGPTAGDLVQVLYAVMESGDAFDFFNAQATTGVYPLYAGAPQQAPFVDGEQQYEVRWTMDVSLQYNPTLTSSVQTASTVTANIINVEATYH